MKRTLGLAATSTALVPTASVAVPGSARAAPSATWRSTGEYHRYKSTCMDQASYYLSASHVNGNRGEQVDTHLWRGMVDAG